MKRLHIHLSVADLRQNIEFYSTLFGSKPTVEHDDYAKWMLNDPRVNFAISNRSTETGLDHLGIQAEDDQQLQQIKQQLDQTQSQVVAQSGVACCYTESDKYWVTDPQGIAWESFNSLNEIPTFNRTKEASDNDDTSACRPVVNGSSSCCG